MNRFYEGWEMNLTMTHKKRIRYGKIRGLQIKENQN